MMECRPLVEGGRSHFMTRRFDRTPDGKKLHMQTLGAIAHYDYRRAGAHGYEQAFRVLRRLDCPMDDIEQQFRRMVFNVVARNQDDHVKNIAFVMDKTGRWRLSPAYDVTYSYNPEGDWTGQHQMSINGKRDHFELEDFKACEKNASMLRGSAEAILADVVAAVARWEEFAAEAGVPGEQAEAIARTHRLSVA